MSLFFAIAVAALCALFWAVPLFLRITGPKTLFIALCALLAPPAAYALAIGGIVNPVIDQFQAGIVGYVVAAAVSAFFSAMTWLGSRIGIRIIERLNRATIEEAAERYANTAIDRLQEAFLGLPAHMPPDLTRIVADGIEYVRTGNPGTVAQGGFDRARLQAYVEAALKPKADALREALSAAGAR